MQKVIDILKKELARKSAGRIARSGKGTHGMALSALNAIDKLYQEALKGE